MIRYILRCLVGAGRRFVRERCAVTAASLAFTTMLAIVPLAALGMYLFAGFAGWNVLMGRVEAFVVKSFVPGVSGAVIEEVAVLVANAATIPVVGIVSLCVTALLMLFEIEHALDDIWPSTLRHSWRTRALTYWAVVTGLPLAGVAVAWILQAVLAKVGIVADWLSWFGGPVLGFLVLLGMYLTFPAKPVPVRFAAAGALIGTILLQAAKAGMAAYVAAGPLQNVVYGALAAVPLLQLWLFALWVIALYGAAFAAELESAT